jgi:hypothetical protein
MIISLRVGEAGERPTMPNVVAWRMRRCERPGCCPNPYLAGFGMLAIGARGAIQVRGKDGVHPEIVWSKQFVK